ncbi:MAG TPA: hypothetical protein VNY74_02715 [Edaphobacter sp.]|nr:hypothetical protein [Edaphobacter sp.]
MAAQPQPGAGTLKPSTNVPTRPVTSVRPSVHSTPAAGQGSVPAQTSTPGMYSHPITNGQPNGSANTAPAQPAQGPSLYVNKPAQSLSPKVTPTQPYVPVQTTPAWRNTPAGSTGTSGTSDGPPAGQSSSPTTTTTPPYTKYNPKTSDGNNPKTSDGNNSKTSDGSPNGSPANGGNSSTGTANNPRTSDGNSNGSRTTGTKPPPAPTPPPTETHNQRPPRVQPQRPHAPVQIFVSPAIPLGQVFPPRGYEPRPPSRVTSPTPPADPSPVSSPTPSAPLPASPVQASGNGQQPQAPAANTTTPNAATPATPQPNGRTQRPGAEPPKANPVAVEVLPMDPTLTLRTKPDRPVVGKDVVVVAALEPSHPGASYRLNWGDGSAVETVDGSGKGTHRYAKAKPYTVSASTVVAGRELNHEVLLQVGLFWPRYDWLLAALAGLAALALHFPSVPVPKLTASPRWGSPGVPEMTLLNREPYLSLSFEPGVGPAEEDITFAKKRRKSGLEQG